MGRPRHKIRKQTRGITLTPAAWSILDAMTEIQLARASQLIERMVLGIPVIRPDGFTPRIEEVIVTADADEIDLDLYL